MARTPPLVLMTTLVVLLLGHATAALKWRLLQGADTTLTVSAALRAHFLGVVSNLWLPGVVGGDVVRAGAAFGSNRRALVLVASLIDRLIDSVALLLISAASLLFLRGATQGAWHLVETGFIGAAVLGAGLFVAYCVLKGRQIARVDALVEAAELIARSPGRVVAALAISAGIQSAFILVNVSLGRAVGMRAPVSAWFMAWPLAKLAAVLPVSAAGLGVREAAFVVLMRPFGDPPASAMATGLLWQATFIVGGLIGWGVSLMAGKPWRSASSSGISPGPYGSSLSAASSAIRARKLVLPYSAPPASADNGSSTPLQSVPPPRRDTRD